MTPAIPADRGRQARCRPHPGSELTVAPGMDHLPPLRDPDLVLRVIKSTLARAGWLSGSRLPRQCQPSSYSIPHFPVRTSWRHHVTCGFAGSDVRELASQSCALDERTGAVQVFLVHCDAEDAASVDVKPRCSRRTSP